MRRKMRFASYSVIISVTSLISATAFTAFAFGGDITCIRSSRSTTRSSSTCSNELPLRRRRLDASSYDRICSGYGIGNNALVRLSASKRGGAMARKKKKKKKKKDNDSRSSAGGFGKSSEEQTKSNLPPTDREQGKGGREIYSLPALYDLAFGYRNYEEEVDFLLAAHEKYGNVGSGGPQNVLELAAGPARHSITALRLGNFEGSTVKSATAVDISADMVEYGTENANQELGDAGTGGLRDAFTYEEGDMKTFCSPNEDDKAETFDSAWILLGSMQHLTTNDDVIDCFQSTARALKSGGTLIIELPHPRETFTMVECTRNGWELPLEDDEGIEYGELKVIWGDDDDVFDPIRQVRDFTITMELTGVAEESATGEERNGKQKSLHNVSEVVPMRLFTSQEIDALARCAGLKVVAMYGALSEAVAVDSEDEAFRLVCVLRKL